MPDINRRRVGKSKANRLIAKGEVKALTDITE